MNKEGPKQNQPKEYYKDGEGSKVQCTKITEAREFVQPRAEESEEKPYGGLQLLLRE